MIETTEQFERSYELYTSNGVYLLGDLARYETMGIEWVWGKRFSALCQIFNGLGQYNTRHWWVNHRAEMKERIKAYIKTLQDLVDTM